MGSTKANKQKYERFVQKQMELKQKTERRMFCLDIYNERREFV